MPRASLRPPTSRRSRPTSRVDPHETSNRRILFPRVDQRTSRRPHIRVSANATPRELFAEQRLQQAVAGLPGDEQILLATRLDPLLEALRQADSRPSRRTRRKPSSCAAWATPSSLPDPIRPACSTARWNLPTASAPRTRFPPRSTTKTIPRLKLRGFALGLQRPEITYEGAEYDYRYTPGRVSLVLRQGRVDQVSRHAGRPAHQHALPVERPSVHLAAEAAEVS